MTHHTTESVERLASDVARYGVTLTTRDFAATILRDLAAERDHLLAAQSYTYIGKDGKPVLARDLEDERDALRARLDEAVELAELNQADAEKAAIAGGCMDRFGIPISIRARGSRIAKLRAFLNGGGNG